MTGSALARDRAAARHVKLTLQLPAGLRLRRGGRLQVVPARVSDEVLPSMIVRKPTYCAGGGQAERRIEEGPAVPKRFQAALVLHQTAE